MTVHTHIRMSEKKMSHKKQTASTPDTHLRCVDPSIDRVLGTLVFFTPVEMELFESVGVVQRTPVDHCTRKTSRNLELTPPQKNAKMTTDACSNTHKKKLRLGTPGRQAGLNFSL